VCFAQRRLEAEYRCRRRASQVLRYQGDGRMCFCFPASCLVMSPCALSRLTSPRQAVRTCTLCMSPRWMTAARGALRVDWTQKVMSFLSRFRSACALLPRGPLPFTKCHRCLASLLVGVLSDIDWQLGVSSEPSGNQVSCSLERTR
jgi:hypothetical protein